MVLHFWREPLSDLQLSAAAAILRRALRQYHPTWVARELDFISVSIPKHSIRRRFKRYTWDTLKPLDDQDLYHFLKRLCDDWNAYQSHGRREFKMRRQPDLFSP
jgi:hypothetical protein